MKVSNKKIVSKQADCSYEESAASSKEKVTTGSSLIIILPFLAMIISILSGVLARMSGMEIAKIGIITMVLTGIASFYIRINAKAIPCKNGDYLLITLAYLGAIILILFIPQPDTFSFWMIGGLLIAMLVDLKLGLLLHLNLSFILGVSARLYPEIVLKLLIIGAIMCLLAGAMKEKATFLYAMIIILSTNITLSFAFNNFIFDSGISFNYLSSLFSILAVLVTSFIMCFFYIRFQNVKAGQKIIMLPPEIPGDGDELKCDTEEKSSAVPVCDDLADDQGNKLQIQSVSLSENTNQKLGNRTSFDLLCNTENDLLRKLKQCSEELYKHALYIGDLSLRAAREIGADEQIAMAGGYYHEIGKINGKNYMEEGLKLAEEYAFPKELTAILKEHNIKYEKPTSIEAAIVMLSDHVVSTIEYIEKSGDQRFTKSKIIENLFQMRMEKGSFDCANLSLNDYKKLKNFYQQEFSSTTIAK